MSKNEIDAELEKLSLEISNKEADLHNAAKAGKGFYELKTMRQFIKGLQLQYQELVQRASGKNGMPGILIVALVFNFYSVYAQIESLFPVTITA